MDEGQFSRWFEIEKSIRFAVDYPPEFSTLPAPLFGGQWRMAEREHFTNGRCFTFGTGLTLVAAAFGAQVGGWVHWITIGVSYGIGVVLMLIAAVLISRSYFSRQSATSLPQTSATMGIPALSALLGQNPATEFDPKQFFALAHFSPATAEIEKNIQIIAQQYSPNDKEAFYSRFIGVGLVAYHHEMSWLLIFGSQMKAMQEMNSRGIIPTADLKKYYDKGAVDYPKTFEDYSLING